MTQRDTSGARRVLGSYPARLVLAVVLVVGGAVGAFHLGMLGNPAPAAQPQTQPPARGDGRIGAGVWLVGADIAPGTYRSTGPDGDGYCMWSRHDTAAGGSMDGILASDGTYNPGQVVVTIEPGDVLFRTRGCAPFVPVG